MQQFKIVLRKKKEFVKILFAIGDCIASLLGKLNFFLTSVAGRYVCSMLSYDCCSML